jgi:phosphoribosylaminoimidazole-succinocarboxamide synthase
MPVTSTQFNFPGQKNFYKGKVRDVYTIGDDLLIMVATDRISAFDVVLPAGIPYKGQVLNQIAAEFLDATSDIVPNWKIATPDPQVTIGHACKPFRVEMVIRGFLTGHAWREYNQGKRKLCGVALPEGMIENQAFLQPIITPTTKAAEGHDQDISREEIITQGVVEEQDYMLLEKYTRELFRRGSDLAAQKGLILVDTKYEFGKKDGKIFLIDELHTPDSSRYFYSNEYFHHLNNHLPQKQLSKEFVREWLMKNGFSGQTGQTIPNITPEIAQNISERYIELYENITGKKFLTTSSGADLERIEKNCLNFIKNFGK